MTDEIITAPADLQLISVQEMIALAPGLFCASQQFLRVEPCKAKALA